LARSTAARSRPARNPRRIGASPPKLEGYDKVTGRALYVDDLVVPGLLHGRTVRSTVARGRIVRIEKDPSFDWDGVVIVDHRDIPGRNLVALIEDDQPLLAADEIRHAEEPILLVAHEDSERAEAARNAFRIEVEPLKPVLTMEASLEAKTLLYSDDNVFKDIRIARGDLDAAFEASDLVIEGEYRVGHQEQLYIENNGMIAERTPEGGIVVRGSLQCPYYIHKALMAAFALPEDRVRVIQTVTGGGFGGKEEYPSMIAGHAALLAWKSGRPVKIMYDRLEDIAATTKRHPAIMRIRTGVMRDGTLKAFDADIIMDGGAYVTLSPVVLSRGAIHAAGPYPWPASNIRARAVATSTPPNGAFRGFGAPQTEFASECHMDRIAETLGLDPIAFRRRHAYRAGDVTPTGQVLRESIGTLEVLDRTVKRVGWKDKATRYRRENDSAAKAERAARARALAVSSRVARVNGHAGPALARVKGGAPARRVRRGIGMSLVYHGSGFTGSGEVRLESVAALELAPDGRPRALAASTEIGQGTITVFSQFIAEQLRVPPEFVLVETPDTGLVPDSGPTVASRTVMVVGGLLEKCAIAMREELESFAGRRIDGAADFQKTARRYLKAHGGLRTEQTYQKPSDVHWNEDTYEGDAYGVFSYAACAVEVEVDLDTFETRVLRVTTAQDIGKAIHPVLAAGQIEGGTLQGLGWALLEEVRWKDGRVWNHQLTNYIIPTSADAPPIDVVLVELPYAHGPQGAKGVGELPMDAPAPAVVAAIANAIGVRVDEIPVTPERLRAAYAAQHVRDADEEPRH
jgi:CO/xanthine dehydrogenase Mo-binding subunit